MRVATISARARRADVAADHRVALVPRDTGDFGEVGDVMHAASSHARSASTGQSGPSAAWIGTSTPSDVFDTQRRQFRMMQRRAKPHEQKRTITHAGNVGRERRNHFLEVKRSKCCFALRLSATTCTDACTHVTHGGIVCGQRKSRSSMTIDDRSECDVHRRRAQSFVVEVREVRGDDER